MESSMLISFGDFSEKERKLYFSEESLKSSGIEFPEGFLFDLHDGRERFVADLDNLSAQGEQDENAEGAITKELDSSFVESFQGKLVTDSKDGNISEAFHGDVLSSINQVSEKYEVKTVVESEVSDLPDNINSSNNSPAELSSPNEEKLSKDKVSPKEDLKSSIMKIDEDHSPTLQEKTPTIQPVSTNASSPTNVVTVGTKTMMTTSTRTVESSHETVKSSWADLFKTKPSSKPQGPLPVHTPTATPKQPDDERPGQDGKDQFRHYFRDVLKQAELTNQTPRLQPRGLKNNANWCYINSTLQVLIFCPSLYHFLMKFKLKTDRGTSSTPILDALVLFASQFSEMAPRQSGGKSQEWSKQEVFMGMPFEPIYVYDLLTQVKTTLSQQGKQEDAEEFLSCILNGLHEEMIQLGTTGDKQGPVVSSNYSGTESGAKEGGGEEWEQVGPRNKSTVTRKSTMAKSPVAEMFGGYLRSSLVQHGMKESASIQPFFSIQLDLRGEVTTVQQAFDNFFRVEEVEGFQCDKSKTEVEVSKKWTLDSLPVVMILHLKRFVVNKNGCEKLTKKISYDAQLHIPPDTLSKVLKIRNKNLLTYKLFAITYHHGKNLHGGHYTSDIFHPTVGWLRADDVNIRTIPLKFVFNPLSNRDPYLLYYSRGDISH